MVIAHRLLAEIATAAGDLSQAEAELTAALEPLRTNPAPLVAWKIYAMLGVIYRLKNNSPAASAAFGHSEKIISEIASNIDDERLRTTFLNAPAVQEVLGRE